MERKSVRLETGETAVEQTRHTKDSQGQNLALAFKVKVLKPFEVFPPGSEAAAGQG